jgi:hypothetical protein
MNDEIDRDESLNRLLRRWQTPAPSAALDHRLMASFRRQTPQPARRRWPIALPLAAAILAAAIWVPRMQRAPRTLELHSVLDAASASYVTRVDASGFQPAPEAAIVITGRKP